MTQDEFIDTMRQEIREEGFMSAVKLGGLVASRAIEFGVDADALEILGILPCDDIKVVEYTNWMTKDYRRKDLFYFIPGGTHED